MFVGLTYLVVLPHLRGLIRLVIFNCRNHNSTIPIFRIQMLEIGPPRVQRKKKIAANRLAIYAAIVADFSPTRL